VISLDNSWTKVIFDLSQKLLSHVWSTQLEMLYTGKKMIYQ